MQDNNMQHRARFPFRNHNRAVTEPLYAQGDIASMTTGQGRAMGVSLTLPTVHPPQRLPVPITP